MKKCPAPAHGCSLRRSHFLSGKGMSVTMCKSALPLPLCPGVGVLIARGGTETADTDFDHCRLDYLSSPWSSGADWREHRLTPMHGNPYPFPGPDLLPLKPRNQTAHENASPSSTINPACVRGQITAASVSPPGLGRKDWVTVSEGLLCPVVPSTQGSRHWCSR